MAKKLTEKQVVAHLQKLVDKCPSGLSLYFAANAKNPEKEKMIIVGWIERETGVITSDIVKVPKHLQIGFSNDD